MHRLRLRGQCARLGEPRRGLRRVVVRQMRLAGRQVAPRRVRGGPGQALERRRRPVRLAHGQLRLAEGLEQFGRTRLPIRRRANGADRPRAVAREQLQAGQIDPRLAHAGVDLQDLSEFPPHRLPVVLAAVDPGELELEARRTRMDLERLLDDLARGLDLAGRAMEAGEIVTDAEIAGCQPVRVFEPLDGLASPVLPPQRERLQMQRQRAARPVLFQRLRHRQRLVEVLLPELLDDGRNTVVGDGGIAQGQRNVGPREPVFACRGKAMRHGRRRRGNTLPRGRRRGRRVQDRNLRNGRERCRDGDDRGRGHARRYQSFYELHCASIPKQAVYRCLDRRRLATLQDAPSGARSWKPGTCISRSSVARRIGRHARSRQCHDS